MTDPTGTDPTGTEPTGTEPTGTDPTAEGRVIDLSVEVPGSPEEVWAAVATGPGITAWFIPHEVEERTGGAVSMDFGSFGVEKAEVRVWDPPHRVVFTGGQDDRVLAYEWTVQARAGGTCIVRLVNSGFGPGEDWDADYNGMSLGWQLFLANLRLHRTHFGGRRAATIVPTGMTPGPLRDAWSRICADLGTDTALGAGEPFATSGEQVPQLRGRVEQVFDVPGLRAYAVVTEHPFPGTGLLAAEGDGEQVMLSVFQYRYGDDEPPVLVDDWTPFFTGRYPFPTHD